MNADMVGSLSERIRHSLVAFQESRDTHHKSLNGGRERLCDLIMS